MLGCVFGKGQRNNNIQKAFVLIVSFVSRVRVVRVVVGEKSADGYVLKLKWRRY